MDAAGCIYIDIHNKRKGHDLEREWEGHGASWRRGRGRNNENIAFTYKILKKVKMYKQKEDWLLLLKK